LVAALARLALIADQLGDATFAANARDAVKTRLNQWLDPTINSYEYPYRNGQQFVYDLTWGGIMPLDGLENPGSAWLGTGGV